MTTFANNNDFIKDAVWRLYHKQHMVAWFLSDTKLEDIELVDFDHADGLQAHYIFSVVHKNDEYKIIDRRYYHVIIDQSILPFPLSEAEKKQNPKTVLEKLDYERIVKLTVLSMLENPPPGFWDNRSINNIK